ncbi:MAG: CvpA family protein [Chloroflexia bacterium]
MRELLAVIPYLDLFIAVLVLFFVYLGWVHGTPRILMVVGSIYTGFLLAAIYYHLFALTLVSFFNIKSMFTAELIAFLVLDVVVTVLMIALLFSLFGHVEVKNRMAVFDKTLGSVLGLATGVLVMGILITLLRVPYEANKQKLNTAAEMPVVQLFNDNYEKSLFSPLFVKGAPYFLQTLKPMLPVQVQEKGAVPLLESIVAQQP